MSDTCPNHLHDLFHYNACATPFHQRLLQLPFPMIPFNVPCHLTSTTGHPRFNTSYVHRSCNRCVISAIRTQSSINHTTHAKTLAFLHRNNHSFNTATLLSTKHLDYNAKPNPAITYCHISTTLRMQTGYVNYCEQPRSPTLQKTLEPLHVQVVLPPNHWLSARSLLNHPAPDSIHKCTCPLQLYACVM